MVYTQPKNVKKKIEEYDEESDAYTDVTRRNSKPCKVNDSV